MKQTGVILLGVLMLVQTFSKCWLVVGFMLNQRQIAATLCVNRNNPNSSCQGKCYLRKQMANEEKQENAPLGNSAKEKFEVLIPDAVHTTPPVTNIASTSFSAYTATIITRGPAAIFHPPCA